MTEKERPESLQKAVWAVEICIAGDSNYGSITSAERGGPYDNYYMIHPDSESLLHTLEEGSIVVLEKEVGFIFTRLGYTFPGINPIWRIVK